MLKLVLGTMLGLTLLASAPADRGPGKAQEPPHHHESVMFATCIGATPCNACKSCRYCKYCAKNGGTCGACKR